jgi:hypothetical protein
VNGEFGGMQHAFQPRLKALPPSLQAFVVVPSQQFRWELKAKEHVRRKATFERAELRVPAPQRPPIAPTRNQDFECGKNGIIDVHFTK